MTAKSNALVLAIAMVAGAVQAHAAITQRVKDACRDEYFSFCSAHEVGSQELRQCMDKAQDQLSQRCLQELVAAGEVSQSQVHDYKAHHHQ
jgi:hypothetical protein